MPPPTQDTDVVGRVTRYLEKLFDRGGEKVSDGSERIKATVDVLTDRDLMDDLQRADAQPDSEARPFEDIKRELGRG